MPSPLKGRKRQLSDEHREKLRRAMLGRKTFKGKHHSPETIEKIRQWNLAPERRAKISKLHKGNKYCVGRVQSAETRAKISKSMLGHKPSPETIERMRLGQLKRYRSQSIKGDKRRKK